MMLELYHNNISVCSQKVRLALAEKSLTWTSHHIGLITGDQTNPDYLKLNPKALVPTLVHDGKVIIESTVINEYLDDTFEDPPLKPADTYARARVRLWTKVPDEGVHTACASISFAGAFAKQLQNEFEPKALEERLASMPDRARAERQSQIMENGFQAPFVKDAVLLYDKTLGDMEAALDDAPWLAGETFSLADIALTAYVERVNRLGLAGFWEPHRPRVTDWFARVCARASFDQSFAAFEPVDYDDLLEQRGGGAWPDVRALLDAV